MESNYNNENLERLLRESSDQYRMYPSEKVWKNVYGVLHTRRRWFGIGLILLLSSGFVTTIMLTNTSPVSNKQLAVQKTSPATTVKESTDNSEKENTPVLTPYSSTYTQKNKISLLLPVNADQEEKNLPVNVGTTVDMATIPVKEINTITELKPENITNATLAEVRAEAPTYPVYTPISINLSDQATDQDVWVFNTGNFLNSDKVKKNVYRLSSSSNMPLSIESVINSYKRKNKKFSVQYYFTPTISYRKLSENKSYLRSQNNANSGNSALYNNINNVVTHKPDMGLEVGAAGRYALSKNVKIRAGLQFNTSRYDIKAFSYASELTTIALNTGYSVDSVSTLSNYRNFNGYKSDWLHNFYFQVSAPIGIELKLAGDDKVQFGIASTIQPTYIIGDRAYLLSSNYKNYAEVPWLIRRWNMNTSFEAFVSYSTGKMNWQIGPQVRYQLYSSFLKEYPVKENLFDFGLKVGVSTNK